LQEVVPTRERPALVDFTATSPPGSETGFRALMGAVTGDAGFASGAGDGAAGWAASGVVVLAGAGLVVAEGDGADGIDSGFAPGGGEDGVPEGGGVASWGPQPWEPKLNPSRMQSATVRAGWMEGVTMRNPPACRRKNCAYLVLVVTLVLAAIPLVLALVFSLIAMFLPLGFPLNPAAFPRGRLAFARRRRTLGHAQGIGQTQGIGELSQQEGTAKQDCENGAGRSVHGVLRWRVPRGAGFPPY